TETGEPVTGANVILSGTNFGAATDLEGKFEINNIRYGSYKMEVSYIGFQRQIIDPVIIDKDIYQISVTLIESAVQTEQIIVTAGKYEQRMEDLPVSSVVLLPNSFAKKNFNSFEDILRYVPGVNMTLEQVSIRGSSGYSLGAGARVLVAMDGVPLYTGDSGEIIWEQIPLVDIERIEVIKGPASSLYGSSAIGGVINVVSKKPVQRAITHIKTYAGFYDKPAYAEWDWSDRYRTFYGMSVTHSNSIDDFGYTFSIKRLIDDSYRKDDYNKRHLGYMKLNYEISPKSSISLLGNYLHMNRGNFLYWMDSRNVLIQKDEDQHKTVESDRLFLSAIYKNEFSDNFSAEFKSSYYHTNFDGLGIEVTSSTADLFRNELIGNFNLSDEAILISGAEFSYSNVKSNIFNNTNFYSAAGYAQLEYKGISKLIATLGMRYDYIKLDTLLGGNAFTPRLGLNYKLSKDMILRASFGTGFRAPTPAEVFITSDVAAGVSVKENPDLEAEDNYSFEAGFLYTPFSYLKFDFAMFHTRYNNFIEPTLLPEGDIQFINIVDARIQGFELVTKYSFIPNELTFSSGYTYLWARDLNLNKAMKYRPRHIWYFNAEFNPFPFEFRIDFRYMSKVEEIDFMLTEPPINLVPEGDQRVAIYVVDLSAGYNFELFNFPVKIFVNAKNLLNYNYVEFIGNLAPLRNVSLSIEGYF
ncbi:TonB-dependent receptor domain-containing protein, partial [Bacteroidota bacterium]